MNLRLLFRQITLALIVFAAGSAFAIAAPPPAHGSAPTLAATSESVDALLARPELSAYRGWLKYLRADAGQTAAREGPRSKNAVEKLHRLADWTASIAGNPNILSELRGPQEWAYESAADGSGQPFRINIPADLPETNPDRRPLALSLHGYSQSHSENTAGWTARASGGFEVAVLGRARGGWYHALSEADVLGVLDYVLAHWPVDPARVHIGGASMGGQGALRIAARHPHRFASAFTQCANFMQQPERNLLAIPLYATHSRDDYVVPIIENLATHNALRDAGGQNIFDETDGLGHAAWNYAEGNRRAHAWRDTCRLPASRAITRLDHTALDGGARRAWWAEIIQWGDAPRPARFIINAAAGNRLHVTLENINALRLDLAASPADRGQPLEIIIDGKSMLTLSGTIPEALTLSKDESNAWTSAPASTETLALPSHTPGGAAQLYDGTPLLIVYGTRGDAAANKAMRAAAIAASKSPNPSWALDSGEKSKDDGVPHHQNLYGRLNTKADTDVTDADIDRCHLVLIGDAVQNALVARLAEKLPVRLDTAAQSIICSDGLAFPAARQTLALTHCNPLSPARLIYWVASTDAAGYAPGAVAPALAASYFNAFDLVITSATGGQLTATRTFDSRWNWHSAAAREKSPPLPAALEGQTALACAIAECARRATGADFAVAGDMLPLGAKSVTSGVTRVSDIVNLFYYERIAVMRMTGAELLALDARLGAPAPGGEWQSLHPRPVSARIERDRAYEIAVPYRIIKPLVRAAHIAPKDCRLAAPQLAHAIERHLTR